ncbi:MAG: carbohydrate ABC transporter permease [bacterium]
MRENLTAYLFIAPAISIISVFGLFPIAFSIYISAHKWRVRRGGFIGLANFREALGNPVYLLVVLGGLSLLLFAWLAWRKMAWGMCWVRGAPVIILVVLGVGLLIFGIPYMASSGDEDMFNAIRVTIWYSLGTVPPQLVLGLILAYFLFQRVPGRQGLRVVYLLPYVVPSVATAAIFELLFSLRSESLANQVLSAMRIPPQQWLRESKGIFQLLAEALNLRIPAGEGVVSRYWLSWAQGPSLALISIMIYNLWVFVGYYALIYLAGLGNIPRELYEAAEVDGASRWHSFVHITIPLLSPTTFFLTLLGVIGTFKAFTHIYVLRTSATRGVVDTMSVKIFFTFFFGARFGYAAALALILFAIILALTILQRRILEERVFYG